MSESPTGIDEGYVKYDSRWTPGPAPAQDVVDELNRWRAPLHAAGLIGHYVEHDVGFGNLSLRVDDGFVISGTQTGHIANTTADHYVLVTRVDIDANRVDCTGPVQASSEALTHAALYALSDDVGAVVHVHSPELWAALKNVLPTAVEDVPYGTPDMAREFIRLWRNSDFAASGVAVMAGHDEGLVSVGRTLAEAAERMLTVRAEFRDAARNETSGRS
ncbi:MAG: class II aldolase/adducin family protein [Woeseiaceae bacterium]|nr:class II aldolase/adducin family protein [Woeseiaceae bacterium]